MIWAANVPTQGFLTPLTIVFQTPLRGTANTLLEVVTTTPEVALITGSVPRASSSSSLSQCGASRAGPHRVKTPWPATLTDSSNA